MKKTFALTLAVALALGTVTLPSQAVQPVKRLLCC